jgi:AcrR family transcriptional regulator
MPASTTPGRAVERLSADERKAALLDVTRELVNDVGPEAITVGVVAERAGVTRTLVYKHFENRDDLLTALYRQEARRLDGQIRAAVDAAPEGFEPKLRAFIDATLDAVEEHAPFFAPLRRAGVYPDARREQGRRDGRTVAYFAGLAAAGYGIDDRPARSVIAVLFSGIRSLLSQMRSRPGAAQHQFLLDTYVEMTIGAMHRLASTERPPGGR